MRVKEWQGEVVFLHEVVPGAADRSYGIQVARLAGLPAAVVDARQGVLAKLEAEDRAVAGARLRRPAAVRRRAEAGGAGADAAGPRMPRLRRSIPTRCRRARRWKRSTG